MATTKTDKRTGCKKGPAAKVLDITLHTEIDMIAKSVQKVVEEAEDGQVFIPTDKAMRAIDLLALSRQMVRTVKADYDARTKAIVDPFKPFVTEKKRITALAEECAKQLDAGLRVLVAQGLIGTAGVDTAAGTRLSLVGKRELVMDDPMLIPDEYLLPRAQCLDWGKIKAKIEAHEKAIEAADEAGIVLTLPDPIEGAHLETHYTFRTKLPDELEN